MVMQCGKGQFITFLGCTSCRRKLSNDGPSSYCGNVCIQLKPCYRVHILLSVDSCNLWAVPWEAGWDFLRMSALEYSVLEREGDEKGALSIVNKFFLCTLSIVRLSKSSPYVCIDTAELIVSRQIAFDLSGWASDIDTGRGCVTPRSQIMEKTETVESVRYERSEASTPGDRQNNKASRDRSEAEVIRNTKENVAKGNSNIAEEFASVRVRVSQDWLSGFSVGASLISFTVVVFALALVVSRCKCAV